MPLSEYEQRVIDDLERSLLRDDPKLANAFRSTAPPRYSRIIGVAVGVLLGIALLILGSVMDHAWMVAVGFSVIFAALVWAASSRRAKAEVTEEKSYNYLAARPKELANTNSSDSNGRFMERLEDRWNRRQSELG